jgi:ribosomal protein S18 acetylase RimI-like enzyme
MTLTIECACLADVEDIAPLFDAYRRFYGQPGDLGLARAFIRERLERSESIIFLAKLDGCAVGYTQLYPSFTSGGAARIFILNDLYVAPQAEGQGVGAALVKTAEAFARLQGAAGLRLFTNVDNLRAQALYRRSGWSRNDAFLMYELPLRSPAV